MTQIVDTVQQVNPAHFDHPTCVFLRAYWEQKRGNRAMPSRADISPAHLKEHLGWIMILDVLPEWEFRYRVIGTLVTEYFGSENTGKTASEAFASHGKEVAGAVNYVFYKCARNKVVMRTAGSANWLLEGMEEFEAIYLPLSDDGETVTHILHAFVCDREKMLLSRQIAKANGGTRVPNPAPKTKVA